MRAAVRVGARRLPHAGNLPLPTYETAGAAGAEGGGMDRC